MDAENRLEIIGKIFRTRNEDGFWKRISETDPWYPDCLHYVPAFRASLWVLILLAELEADRNDHRVTKVLEEVKNHLYDSGSGIYSLRENHFPIPCLNGNMVYIDGYFNNTPDSRTLSVLNYFAQNQRFDDGQYEEPESNLCRNTSCYGRHTCYWGIIKLLKGISFLPESYRTPEIRVLRDRCIRFVLKHHVCYRSHDPERIMIAKIDLLTFPNMYKSDFLEILWILKREKVWSENMAKALQLLKSKRRADGTWPLERKISNLVVSVGQPGQSNPFITKRAREVLDH